MPWELTFPVCSKQIRSGCMVQAAAAKTDGLHKGESCFPYYASHLSSLRSDYSSFGGFL